MKNNVKHKLYGAILGDLCGQPFEFPIMSAKYSDAVIHNPDSHITDDTVLTLATAYAIMNGLTFESVYKEFGKKYTDEKNGLGYGSGFKEWIDKPLGILNKSYGNGCLMRISPAIYAAEDANEMEFLIAASCYCSHAHNKSFTSCMDLADLYIGHFSSEAQPIEKFKKFEVTAEPTYRFIENLFFNMWESDGLSTQDCILTAVECGGDTDTNASIIGELGNSHNNDITDEDVAYVDSKLEEFPELLKILKDFNEKY